MTENDALQPLRFVRGNDHLDRLLSDPQLAADVAQAHAEAEELAAETDSPGQITDQLAADLLAAQLPGAPRRRLAFAAASTSGRGAAEADEMLAEGFGRD